MALMREEAWNHLCEWTKTDSLRTHAKAVGLVMKQAAYRYGKGAQEEEMWEVAGILHDADYDQWPQEHPKKIMAWLEERGENVIAHAVSAHYTKWNVPYETVLDKALLACDELTGLVMACSFVRPDGIASLGSQSVLKKFKDKGFAAKVDREDVKKGVELLGVDLATHMEFVITALRPHASELGLEGRGGQ